MHQDPHSCVLVGKHSKPFNNFGEIAFAPLVLNPYPFFYSIPCNSKIVSISCAYSVAVLV